MEEDIDRKKDIGGSQPGLSFSRTLNQNSNCDDPRLKIGERYLVRRFDDSWRMYIIFLLKLIYTDVWINIFCNKLFVCDFFPPCKSEACY